MRRMPLDVRQNFSYRSQCPLWILDFGVSLVHIFECNSQTHLNYARGRPTTSNCRKCPGTAANRLTLTRVVSSKFRTFEKMKNNRALYPFLLSTGTKRRGEYTAPFREDFVLPGGLHFFESFSLGFPHGGPDEKQRNHRC